MRTIIISSNGQPYIWKVMDISGERYKTDNVMVKIKEIIADIKRLNLTILAIVIDSAPAYNTAQ